MITHCVVMNQRTTYSAGWTGKGRYIYVYQILKSFKKKSKFLTLEEALMLVTYIVVFQFGPTGRLVWPNL